MTISKKQQYPRRTEYTISQTVSPKVTDVIFGDEPFHRF